MQITLQVLALFCDVQTKIFASKEYFVWKIIISYIWDPKIKKFFI